MSESCLLPEFDDAAAALLAGRLFGLDGPLRRLDGERDLNFLVGEAGARKVFKIANAEESLDFLECQHQVLDRIDELSVFPLNATALESVHGRRIEVLKSPSGQTHYCRALPYLEGRLLCDVEAPAAVLLEDLGGNLARLDLALEGYRNPALDRPLLWRMDRATDVVDACRPSLTGAHRQQLVERVTDNYRANTIPRLAGLRRGLIHNDANHHNVLVDDSGARVLGLIDFGDMIDSWRIVEAAVAATYAMLDQDDPLPFAAAVLRGYHRVTPLGVNEIAVVPDLIRLRAAISVCISARQLVVEPGNHYLSVDSAEAWRLFEYLAEQKDSDVLAAISPF